MTQKKKTITKTARINVNMIGLVSVTDVITKGTGRVNTEHIGALCARNFSVATNFMKMVIYI